MGLNFIKRLRQIRDQLTFIIKKTDEDRALKAAQYLQEHLYNNPKYLNSKRLNKHEFQAFSQYGEDGIIREIFNRIGTTNKYFIEFGVENGYECNSLNLLYKQWSGLWIEGSKEYCDEIATRFSDLIQKGQLTIKNNFITAENIEAIFKSANVPQELDLLSIDIDYNDYYVWQAIKNYNPRVVVIEFNAVYDTDTEFVVPYNAERVWDKTSYFGASLLSLEKLGLQKGYNLVGCSFSGANAFFVRQDLVGDKFEAPFTAANHYEPVRFFLYHKNGHPRGHRPN